MAFKIIRDSKNFHQYGREIVAVLDSASDLEALGTGFAPGSTAMVAAKDGPIYMVNASGEWEEL